MYDFESIHPDQLISINGGQVADTQATPCPPVMNCNVANACPTYNGSVVNGGSGGTFVGSVSTSKPTTNISHGFTIGGITIPLPFGPTP